MRKTTKELAAKGVVRYNHTKENEQAAKEQEAKEQKTKESLVPNFFERRRLFDKTPEGIAAKQEREAQWAVQHAKRVEDQRIEAEYVAFLSRINSAYPDAKSRLIVDFEGKSYQRIYTSAKSKVKSRRRGGNHVGWYKAWVPVDRKSAEEYEAFREVCFKTKTPEGSWLSVSKTTPTMSLVVQSSLFRDWFRLSGICSSAYYGTLEECIEDIDNQVKNLTDTINQNTKD